MKWIFDRVFFLTAILLIAVPLLRPADSSDRPSADGAVVAGAALENYGRLLARIADDAAEALESGELTNDRQLLEFITQRREVAARAAFEHLHEHQQQQIGVRAGEEFDPVQAAQLMREYSQGWAR